MRARETCGTRTGQEFGVKLNHRCQPILVFQLRPAVGVRSLYPSAYDRPVEAFAGIKQFVEIDRLMGAVEVTDTDMQDASAQVASFIGRSFNSVGQIANCGQGKLRNHQLIHWPPSTL